jgi:riboflavin kinase
MGNVTFEGKVVSGQGSGRKYLALPWVKSQIEEKLGYTPYLGTLNLKLTAQSVTRKEQLVKAKAMEIRPAEGYCMGLVFKASVSAIECAVVAPKVEGYPANLLEIIAPIDLRRQLHLKDGDALKVTVAF